MNTIYRIVWNAVTCRWVVASELAKGHKKQGTKLRQLAAISGVVGILAASPMAMAGPANGFSAGILGNASCLSTATPGSVLTNGGICDSAGGGAQAGLVSYTASGGWGAYLTVTDPNTVRLGAGGSDKLQVLGSGIRALATMDMGNNNITNLANGGISSGSSDAVNGSQIFNVSQSVANALGGGSVVNANGTVSAPSYALTNANSIGGTAGAATTVASGFSKVDTALGTLNTAVTTAQTTANTANTTANKGWNLSADAGATSQNIAPGGTANFAAGTNATVTRSGNAITMGVVNNPTFSGMLTANGGLTVGAGKTVSMGGNTVTNVANGVNNNDAVSVAQLTPIVTALGNGAAINGTTGAVTGPSYALTNANSIGGTSGAATDVGTAFGKVDTALGTLGTSVTTAQTTANTANTTANKGWNLSADAGATSQNIAPGGTANFAAGTNATVTRSGNTITMGVVNNPTFSGMLTANGGLTVGAGQTVSMGGNKVTNVASGALTAASADAVNGSQLYATNQQVAQNTSDIAGNTTAIAGNTTSISNITNQINNGTVGLVQQAAAGADLTVGKGTDGVAVNFADKTGNTRTLKNVTAGVAATDAVNMSQLNATNANVAGNTTAITNLGTRVTTNEGSISTINTTIAGMNGQLADTVKYDSGAHNSVTLSAASTDAVNGSQLFATNQNVAQNTSDIAGNTTSITNLDGRVTTVEGDISTINTQINSGTIGLVQQSAAGANLTVGKATDGAAVDFAGTAGARKLINVADGTVAVGSKDAVNGSQLFATNQNVAQNTSDIAGNTTSISNLDGRVTNVSNITNGQSGMFQVSKDSNGTQPVASGSKSTAGGNGTVASGNNSTALGNAAVASSDNSVALGANSVADRSNSVSVGSAGKERQVTNVAAGTANTDAVNVGQLKAAGVMNSDGSTNTAVTYDTNADGSASLTLNGGGNAAVIHNVGPGSAPSDAATVGQVQQAANWSKSYTDQQVNSMGRQVSGGVAAAMAMTSIPQAVAAGQNSIGAGVGTFRGQSSIAVGMSALSASGKFAVKFSASATTQGDAGVGVGASYIW